LPEKHAFRHSIFTFGIDLDELGDPFFEGRLFAYNRIALLSLRDRDYLQDMPGSIREKLAAWLRTNHNLDAPERVHLLTMPRLMGYAFNPVSFYIGWNLDGTLHSIVTEVNNTFGEKHLYLLRGEPGVRPPASFDFSKEFFVSPFFPVDGSYRLTLEKCDDDFALAVDLIRDGDTVFTATLGGKGSELSTGRIAATLIRYPITTLITMGRIYKEAFKLYFWRSATIFRRPEPESEGTVRSRLQPVHRLRLALLSFGKRRDDSQRVKR
jgi:cyclopropane-fatty-acyl-phospholipid synthase